MVTMCCKYFVRNISLISSSTCKFLFSSFVDKKKERSSLLHKFVARGFCVFLAFLVAKYNVPFWLADIMLKVYSA